MELKKVALVALAAFALIFSLRAQEGPPPPSPNGRGPQSAAHAAAVQQGKTLFQQNCAVCHGTDLTGGRGPDLIRSTLVRHDKGGDLIGPVVTNGRADRGMPSFPLSQEQVSDIVAYIDSELTLFDLHTRIPGGYPNDIPASRLATGSAEAGKAFFDGPGGCTKCHSVTGDLAHIASKYDAPDLETHFLYPPGVPNTATVTLPSGKTFEGVLLLNDGFNVGIRGTDGWYHSWPRSAVKLEVHDPLAAHAALLDKYTDAEMHDMFTYLETLK
ncbi:MAG TPA: cytochrome c [Candidatus Baltobacteraceae bacterium]|nr:cytochrome c [Candidatus Baltobacteraceae bacterium]